MKSDGLSCTPFFFPVKKVDNFITGIQNFLVHSGAIVDYEICKNREATYGTATVTLFIFPNPGNKSFCFPGKGFKSLHVSDIWLGQSSK